MHSYTEPENENEGETNDEKVVDRHYKRSNSVRSAGRLWRPDSTDRRLAYIQEKGTLKIGITLFQPMNYYDESE